MYILVVLLWVWCTLLVSVYTSIDSVWSSVCTGGSHCAELPLGLGKQVFTITGLMVQVSAFEAFVQERR